ncbi:MAG: helix-turn-helix domain-containing protein [Alphaproteobacteria bacterium]|nr:helix-turn-helix domain-containing protein [Alphaproteobacteria bacterium]
MQQKLGTMLDLALRHVKGLRTPTAIPRVNLNMMRQTTQPMPGVYQPMLCLILQGAKEVTIGDQRVRYDPANYFIASLELPATGCVVDASAEKPYVGVSMALDREVLAALISDAPSNGNGEAAGFGVSPVTPELLDAWLRLLRLLDTPQDIRVLAPLVEREILYRLLQGPHGALLRQIARADSRLSQVRRAIAWIREHYDQALRVESLAEIAGMSTASFHRHFKATTAMSPLQYQKSLRLQQARMLLIADEDASRAAYAVGYESASQFSREYARLFGAPPARDATRLRGANAPSEDIGA